ncbi:hypothetical protein CHE29_15805 [Salmonella enterica]|nr:hypothetical protein CHE29_15805 [Salmonella enterica]
MYRANIVASLSISHALRAVLVMIAKDVIRKLTQIVDNRTVRREAVGWHCQSGTSSGAGQNRKVPMPATGADGEIFRGNGYSRRSRDSAGLCRAGAVDFEGKTEWILIGAGQRAGRETFVPDRIRWSQ